MKSIQPSQSAAVEVNHLDVSARTAGCAIAMATRLGRDREIRGRKNHKKTVQRNASVVSAGLSSILAGLQSCYCKGQVAPKHQYECGEKAGNSFWQLAGDAFGLLRDNFDDSMALQFLVLAVDSARDLRVGRSGVASIVAGGEPRSFKSVDEDRFLVIAINPESTDDFFHVDKFLDESLSEESALTKLIGQLFERLGEREKKDHSEFTFASMHHDALAKDISTEEKKLCGLLGDYCRVREFQGSPVTASLSALLPGKTDAFAGVVNRVQASLIATAADCLNGQFFALPIRNLSEEDRWSQTDCLGLSDFVSDVDKFLMLTGITDSLVLPGVEYHGDGRATTHSICLRSGNNSLVRICHEHDLNQKMFPFLADQPGAEPIQVPFSELEEVLRSF